MMTTSVWNSYNSALSAAAAGSRTSNIIGDYAEDLVAKVTHGRLAKTSQKGYDVFAKGKRIQVKATRQNLPLRGNTSDLNNDDFDELIGIIFDKMGNVFKAVKVSKEKAKELRHNRSNGSWSISWGKLAKNGSDITPQYKYVTLP